MGLWLGAGGVCWPGWLALSGDGGARDFEPERIRRRGGFGRRGFQPVGQLAELACVVVGDGRQGGVGGLGHVLGEVGVVVIALGFDGAMGREDGGGPAVAAQPVIGGTAQLPRSAFA